MKKTKYYLRINHWNCFKLTVSRIEELRQFLIKEKPDVFSIQETKLNDANANLELKFHGYTMYHRQRESKPKKGGGIAILIRDEIPHSRFFIKDFEKNEALGLKIECGNTKFNLISYYSPPNELLDKNLIINLIELGEDVVIMGDLNAKTKSIGCKVNNISGSILEDLLIEQNISILNNLNPTYFTFNPEKGYTEILDLFLSSLNLSGKINNFQVLDEDSMGSDHCPISCQILLNDKPVFLKEITHKRLNFNRANWALFQEELTKKAYNSNSIYDKKLTVEELNHKVTEDIQTAANNAIPFSASNRSNSLPNEILKLIKQKKRTKEESYDIEK